MKTVFTLLFFFCLSCSLRAGCDESIEKSMALWDVPGVAMAVVKEGQVVFIKGYGTRTVGKIEPVDENSIFAIGSLTKAFTAAALLQLVDEGKLDLENPVCVHVKDLVLKEEWMTREVSVEDLLVHRTGLERADLLWYATSYDRHELFSRLKELNMVQNFRSEFRYNNLMYMLAGEIIPAITHKSWDEWISERIFSPLGMRRSTTSIVALKDEPNLAHAHQKINGKITEIPLKNGDNVGPAGSIHSSAYDMAEWVKMLLAKGQYEGGRLLSEESISEMFAPRLAVEPLKGEEYGFLCYGLGWYVDKYFGHQMIWHAGCVDGMGALVAMIPSRQLGIVILTNRLMSGLLFSLRNQLLDLYLGRPLGNWDELLLSTHVDFEEKAAQRERENERQRRGDVLPTLPLDEFLGAFSNELYGRANISKKNGQLFVDVIDFHYPLKHFSGDTFCFDPHTEFPLLMNKVMLTFLFDSKGHLEGFRLLTMFGPNVEDHIWKKEIIWQK